MAWTQEQWEPFVSILRHGFVAKDRLTEAEENVYAVLLDKVDPAGAVQALTEMVLAGRALRPKPGEIVAAMRADPSTPTFEEMFALLFSQRGALAARGIEGTRARLVGMHPLVVAFAERHGIQRLKELPVHDPDTGHWRCDELKEWWTDHLEASAQRDTAALAGGSTGSGDLARFDPLAALGIARRPELGA